MDDWKNPDIIYGSWWEFPSLDSKGGLHSNNYHGQFIPQVAEQLILRYTQPGDCVLDMFLGSGTTAIECDRLGRLCIGVDLKTFPGVLSINNLMFLEADSSEPYSVSFLQDAIETHDWPQPKLCILHPPYHNIIRFSDNPADLSNQPNLYYFYDKLLKVMINASKLTTNYMALVLGDLYLDGKVEPLAFKVLDMVFPGIGWKLKAINVKNIRGAERGPGNGKLTNLWKYRAYKNGFNLFEHEYVMVFKK